MDVLSSAEFRKVYAKLTEVTVVTANGHVIGEWHPIERVLSGMARGKATTIEALPAFNSRPFTPVPKTRK